MLVSGIYRGVQSRLQPGFIVAWNMLASKALQEASSYSEIQGAHAKQSGLYTGRPLLR
jgi:hypothetical protein